MKATKHDATMRFMIQKSGEGGGGGWGVVENVAVVDEA